METLLFRRWMSLPPIQPLSKRESWKMFNRISSRYDLTNHLLSFGMDIRWRQKVAKYLPKKFPLFLLDIATGTGDQLFSLVKRSPQIQRAMGIDLSDSMLEKGKNKLKRLGYQDRIILQKGDAQEIPLDSNSVDCVTMSFGIRNVEKVDRVLLEVFRVLKQGGKLFLLEFSLPQSRAVRLFHLTYLRYFIPLIGGWITNDRRAYEYLYQTIKTFPYGMAFCHMMKKAGFSSVFHVPFTFGVTTLYIGEKGCSP